MPRHPPTASGHSFLGGLRRPDGFVTVLITRCSPRPREKLPQWRGVCPARSTFRSRF